MIRLYDLTPEVYYKHSRDFQFIGRLYDLVLNSVKTNTDMLFSLPLSYDSDEKLLDLMSMTFGFKSKHNYNVQQLKSLCACFARVIRNKGNIQSIQDACNALCGAEGIKETIYIDRDEKNINNLIIYVPQELSDINLLKDLLNYILPAGLTCQVIKTLKKETAASTKVLYSDSVKFTKKPVHGSWTSQVVTHSLSPEEPTKDFGETNFEKTNENYPFDYTGAFANTVVVSTIKAKEPPETTP